MERKVQNLKPYYQYTAKNQFNTEASTNIPGKEGAICKSLDTQASGKALEF